MKWLMSGGEITLGVGLFVGLVCLVAALRPPTGTLEPRRIISFPGAWIIVGLPLTFAFGVSVALFVIGVSSLR
jgi:hypothetical protein